MKIISRRPKLYAFNEPVYSYRRVERTLDGGYKHRGYIFRQYPGGDWMIEDDYFSHKTYKDKQAAIRAIDKKVKKDES